MAEAEHLHHSLEVVSQHVQAHLGAHVLEPSSQEVRRPHPVLERSEDCQNDEGDELGGRVSVFLCPDARISGPWAAAKQHMAALNALDVPNAPDGVSRSPRSRVN